MLKSFRGFEQGFAIDFDVPITILVGDMGCGKSTLLDLIRTEYKPAKQDLWSPENMEGYCTITGTNPGKDKVRHFDFHANDMKYAGVFGDDMGAQLNAMHHSSGQGVTIQLASSKILDATNSLVLLDEVGRGYSLNMQYKFAMAIYLKTMRQKNQVLLSTHSESIMELADLMPKDCILYSVEHRSYMTKPDFLREHIKFF